MSQKRVNIQLFIATNVNILKIMNNGGVEVPKIEDLNESEKHRAKLDKDGNVLCIECEKNLAKISEYGMIRRCDECANKKYFFVSMDEPGGRKYY